MARINAIQLCLSLYILCYHFRITEENQVLSKQRNLDIESLNKDGLDPISYVKWKKKQNRKRRNRFNKIKRNKKRRNKNRRIDVSSERKSLKTEILVPKISEEYDMVESDNCPDIGGISGFTFLNFILSAVTIGANIVSNINSNSNNNNNNNNNNNDNVNNLNIASNNNNANNMNTIAILPGGRKICSPPCKNTSRYTRQKRQLPNKKYLNKMVDSGKDRNDTASASQQQGYSSNLCFSRAQVMNTTSNHISTYDIYSSAAFLVEQFEHLLAIKRCEIRQPGSCDDLSGEMFQRFLAYFDTVGRLTTPSYTFVRTVQRQIGYHLHLDRTLTRSMHDGGILSLYMNRITKALDEKRKETFGYNEC